MSKQKMSLASFIASQREKLGNISQVELAKKCGVPAGTIASIESGYAKSPRPVTLKKLAEGLSVPPDIIFKLASSPEKEISINYDNMNVFRIPYLGDIPTTKILNTETPPEELLVFPFEFLEEGDYIVTIKGDSLIHEDLYDEDYVVVVNQNFLKRSGDLMLLTIDDATTLRRVYKCEDNYKIDDKVYTKNDLTFLGKASISISRRKL
jgi:SOS-response transcriptional repressor LexA